MYASLWCAPKVVLGPINLHKPLHNVITDTTFDQANTTGRKEKLIAQNSLVRKPPTSSNPSTTEWQVMDLPDYTLYPLT